MQFAKPAPAEPSFYAPDRVNMGPHPPFWVFMGYHGKSWAVNGFPWILAGFDRSRPHRM